MVFLYNKITKKWSFFYLHLLTGCVIMALVEKRKSKLPFGSDGSQTSGKERDYYVKRFYQMY